MMVTIAVCTLVAAGLLAAAWTRILNFLNGWLRDKITSLFGPEKSQSYVDFLVWLDGKASFTRNRALALYQCFKERVLRIREHYRKTDVGYVRRTETVVRKPDDARKGVRTVVEEEVPWEELPSSVRKAMICQNAQEAELDDMEIIDSKVREKLELAA